MTEPIQIESPQANINRARFAGKDFFTFVDDLVARIQALFVTEFNDFVASGTGIMLIDIVSWAAETLSFYIDRQATESYIETARTRRAINRLARQVGYKMRAAVAAAVDLEVNLAETHAFACPIPVGFQFKGPNDLIFESIQVVTFPAGEGPLSPSRTVACREGTTKTEVFTGDGTRNQAYRLRPGDGKFVADGSVSIRVDGTPWTISTFISFDATNQCEIDFNTEPPLLRFGDGIAGNIPPAGSEIRATYLSTSGEAGLVLHDTITSVVTPLVVAFTNIGLVITNPDPSSGASNRESLEEAKRNAPLFFYARDAAVTREDYIGLSQAYSDPLAGTVSVAQAFVALGADDDITLQTLLANIRAIVGPLASTVTGYMTSAAADLASLSMLRDDAEDANTDIGTSLSNITTAATTSRSEATDAKNDAIQAEAQIAAARAIVTTIGPSAGPDALTNVTYTALLGHFTDADTETGSIRTHCNNIVNEADNIDTEIADATLAQGTVASKLTAISPLIVTIDQALVDTTTLVNAGFEGAIEDLLVDIYNHVDGFLANECQSNLVQVPILTRDVDGFLSAPPIALMRSLETYLRAHKEVTQVVEVTSGESWLVAAVITGIIGVKTGYVQSTVLSNVLKAIDDILRNREFGQSLYLSEIMQVAPDPTTGIGGIEGVSYAKLLITGPATYLDTYGNLIITKELVITKGAVTITTEAVA
jgi:hypothetical protein